MDAEVKKSLDASFMSVSRLTSWADTVIISGEVESADSVLEKVIEPVRKSVIVVVNLISGRIGNKNLTRGNSLPDITCESPEPSSVYGLSMSSESILDLSPVKPPLLPKISLRSSDSAPPLPPKHLKPRLDRQLDDLISRSYSFHHGDSLKTGEYYGFSGLKRAPRYGFPANNKSLPTPEGLDTTLLDNSFDFMDYSPYSLSKESVNNISFDEVDSGAYKPNFNLASRSWSSKERSNASSPSLESFGSHLSDTMDREQPPAIPRKYRETPGRWNGVGLYASPDTYNRNLSHNQPRRKLSEYDNVMTPERTLDSLARLSLEDSSRGGTPTTTWSKIAESRHTYTDRPPPLPPKKRNVMSYMEMFGKTILPSGEDILHGFFQTHDLLHNVWQHNFHEYTEYAPAGLLNFPLMDNAGRQNKKSTSFHHNTDFSDIPPALPPKKSRSRPGSFRSSLGEERSIPIIREDSGIRMSQASDNSMSSNSSSETPKLAEITKLPRLSVAIPIERGPKEQTSQTSAHGLTDQDTPKLDTDVLNSNEISSLLLYGSSQDKSAPGAVAAAGGTSELREDVN